MGFTGSARTRPLVVGLATVALAGFGLAMPTAATPAPSNTDVTLTSGTTTQSEWTIVNDDGTLNGTPTGGGGPDAGADCPSPQLPGLAVEEGDWNTTGSSQGDAFDGGLLFFVNNQEVVAPTNWDVQADPSNPTLNRVLTSGPTSTGGLNTTVEYRALPNQQVLRSTVTLSNPGSTPMTVPFAVATNFGSDGNTTVHGTSNGDAVFNDADRWVVTSDNGSSPDAVNTSVLAGPGQIAAAPTATSMTVFDCSGAQGVQATYHVTVPAGGTSALMFFNELSDTPVNALGTAARFNANPGATDELLLGLSDAQRASIVNWKLATTQQPDGQIRELNSKDYLGNNVYNTTGKKQTVKTTAHHGNKRTFRVKIYNDGNATATLAAHGLVSGKGVKVKYFAGGKNVTAQMNSAAGLSFTRAPHKALKIKVKVKINKNATGHRKVVKVIGTSTASGFVLTDTVRAIVKVS
jgi:hypothetical protein